MTPSLRRRRGNLPPPCIPSQPFYSYYARNHPSSRISKTSPLLSYEACNGIRNRTELWSTMLARPSFFAIKWLSSKDSSSSVVVTVPHVLRGWDCPAPLAAAFGTQNSDRWGPDFFIWQTDSSCEILPRAAQIIALVMAQFRKDLRDSLGPCAEMCTG